ncbi:MAG: N-acetylglucosamine-6-phosphate deacetylase [Clostridia bacterium]|nr:N-acetylglucosamine-6-phosphate deacetylase [Clostridia bacterium]
MKCIINGRVVLPDCVADNLAVIFSDKIEKIIPANEISLSDYEVIDAKGNYVAPGLIDIHIHGYMGEDASDADAEGLRKMAEGLVANGVTSWCPTTMTIAKEDILKAYDCIRAVKNSGEYYGAKILGVNSEGPFINPSKKGAQAEEHILRPDADFILDNKDIVKLFTVAPEVDGAKECVEKVRANSDITVSMGHTDATYEEANAGISWGVTHATHLFNAMTALMHRNPGVVGAALSDDNVSCELIADTFHVNKGLFSLVSKIKGDKLCIITDCLRSGGMPDGDYTLGGQPITKKGIECRLADGTIAGSVLTLNKGVYNLLANTDLSVSQAVNCASLNPAKAIKSDREIGSIEVGKKADIIIADGEFEIISTIIDGEIRYNR